MSQVVNIAECRLCHRKRELRNSHIFPEFLYSSLYDDEHKFFRLSTDPCEPQRTKWKGIRERLFCEECECHLNEYEDYVSKVLNGQIKIERTELEDRIILRGLDYKRFKLFEMSLIWRANIASSPEFSQVTLGPIHSEQLRLMILDGTPGLPHEYGCLVFYSDEAKEVTDQLILPPDPMIWDDFGVYRTVLGGFFWAFIFSDRPETFPLRHLFLSQDGVLVVYRNNKLFKPFLVTLGHDLKNAQTFVAGPNPLMKEKVKQR